uniref:F-box domain-containing protein n=1 Tax=Oryza nivara TaxID=4536 RepID=A0A0E0IFD5_ORYNI
MEDLPDDLLLEVLRRLPPISLDASRVVCSAWRAAVDANRLLRADLLPLSVAGIVVNPLSLGSRFLCRPNAAATIADDLDDIRNTSRGIFNRFDFRVSDHCNGLFLVDDDVQHVVNPDTRQWAPLPGYPPPHPCYPHKLFSPTICLVFDPAVSPHFEVLVIPRLRSELRRPREWPPSPFVLRAFSSRTGGDQWEDRISLSNGTYRVIQSEPSMSLRYREKHPDLYLGKSEKGVHCARVSFDHLMVWFLSESHGQMKWVLKHRSRIASLLPRRTTYEEQSGESWILHGANYQGDFHADADDVSWMFNLEWQRDSYDDDDDHHEDKRHAKYVTFLGFHPFDEEVVFLGETFRRGFAYNLNNSEIQDLGNLCPKFYDLTCHQALIQTGKQMKRADQ